MFPSLLRLIARPLPPSTEIGPSFILEVNKRHVASRDPRTARFILICWILIALKHIGILYACHRWPMPFHPLWVNAPTLALGLLATATYYRRRS